MFRYFEQDLFIDSPSAKDKYFQFSQPRKDNIDNFLKRLIVRLKPSYETKYDNLAILSFFHNNIDSNNNNCKVKTSLLEKMPRVDILEHNTSHDKSK